MTDELPPIEDLPIILEPAPSALLTTRCEENVPLNERWSLVANMVSTMRVHRGIGLAANQVGRNYRMFVMDGVPPLACFNPRIVDTGEEQVVLEEGCLSFPGLMVKVKRPKNIKVRYEDADGETHTEKLTGMTARVFQHELDHLDGILFYNRASRVHRDTALAKWRKRK